MVSARCPYATQGTHGGCPESVGTGGRTRTDTPLLRIDFESIASAISPRRRGLSSLDQDLGGSKGSSSGAEQVPDGHGGGVGGVAGEGGLEVEDDHDHLAHLGLVGPAVAADGLLHLHGPDGLLRQLKDAGCTVEQLK